MSDIFQEIDEDLRQDKVARLWKVYGKYLVALAVFIILVIASFRFIEHKNEKNREQTSELYELASEAGRSGDKKAAIELFSDEMFDENMGYSIISKLKKAALAKSNNDLEGTEIVLKEIITNEDIPLYLRDLARLKLFASDSDNNSSQLEVLLEEEGPWKFLALELKGGIQLEGGNLKEARSIFKKLTDDANTPNNLRRRASEILKALP
ncbi:tetratricopeptide repeat protein [Rhodospirillaceae bacterium]|nr:tetratricopeptide repeat protein [Rhodospirillaceae bacterium]